MNHLLRSTLIVLFLCTCGQTAFETTRALTPRTPAFDPMSPAALFWLSNPATLSFATPTVTAAYARPFGLAELESGIAGVNLQRHSLAIAVGLTTLGRSNFYRESDLNLAAARRFGPSLSVGATLHYLDLRFGPRFSPWQFVAADLGLWYESPRGTGIGLSRSDQIILQPASRSAIEPVTRFSLSYRYSPPLGLRLGAEYRDRWVFAAGETLLIAERLHLHADLLTAPLRIVVGARLRTPAGFFDLTHRNHPDLGGDLIVEWGTVF